MGGDEFSQKYLEKLEQDIDHTFVQYKATNSKKMVNASTAAIKGPIKGLLKVALIIPLYTIKFVSPPVLRFWYSGDRWGDVS
jgi:hypothetical protein